VQNTFELEHDLVINALSTEIFSVGAGGGSIVSVAPSGAIRVGPESAGAEPGPACYGRGGIAPTVTDACLVMGILDGQGFAGGELTLDENAAAHAFEDLPTPLPFADRVRSAYRLAVAHMAEEITNVAVRHGVDPRDFSLMAYGAAGPMLLPAVLDLIPLREVVVPPHPGLFSAIGLLATDQVHYESRSAYVPLAPGYAERINEVFESMEQALRDQVAAADGAVVRRSLDGRLIGQSWETPFIEVPAGRIDADAIDEIVRRFHAAYELRNGNRFDGMPVEGVTYRVELTVPGRKVDFDAERDLVPSVPRPEREIVLRYLTDGPTPASEYRRERLPRGAALSGPAVIREDLATTIVLPGQRARIGAAGEIIISLDVEELA
jgi:N-methylhydantoinase A